MSKLFLWLVGLIILLIVMSAVAEVFVWATPSIMGSNSQSSQEKGGMRIPPPQPPLTAADTVAAQQSVPFQFLISYTNSGFEPQTLTIKAGQTVRFTNNSTGQLWVAASGDALYPPAQNGCGSSALDDCAALNPGYFWQFTFTQKGTWEFQNNLDKNKTGVVQVR